MEQQLFAEHIQRLEDGLTPVLTSYNINSLGIYDFISGFKDELKRFNEIKNKVNEKVRMIRDIIEKIKNTKLIKDDHIVTIIDSAIKNDHMMLNKFYSMMEQSVKATVEELLEKYAKIGEVIIPQIEFAIFKTNTGQCQ